MYFLGADAGGTKTAFVLSDENGRILARHNAGPCTFISYGSEHLAKIMREGLDAICAKTEISPQNITYAALGIPGCGEKENSVTEITAVCESAGLTNKITCANDSYIGWAGSLALQPGVNIIAGTGSICYGVNAAGETARSSGWGHCCDEGSCRWLGERLIALYAKQADGRLPRTPLYEIFRKHFNINEDLHFIHQLNHGLGGKEIAALQVLLLEAYNQGDEHAKILYNEAAAELVLASSTVARKLNLITTNSSSASRETAPKATVSYSGGLFKAGDCILVPLSEKLAEAGCRLVAPKFPPELGAVLIAMQQILPKIPFEDFTDETL